MDFLVTVILESVADLERVISSPFEVVNVLEIAVVKRDEWLEEVWGLANHFEVGNGTSF